MQLNGVKSTYFCVMTPGPSTPDLIRQSAETVGRLLRWIAELFRRRDWFMLLVVLGVMLTFLGSFFRGQINERLPESAKGPFWASLITGIVLFFLGALVVAVVTMPHHGPAHEPEVVERTAIKGLRPFDRKDTSIFTQLQREISLRECCEAVMSDTYKFGVLMGESGCGKTSFLQAGLWPKLTEPESTHRAIYVRFSDQEPIETVREALAEQLEIPLDWLGECAFPKLLTQAIEAAGKPIVLLFDQFEQFFVHHQRQQERVPFVHALNAWYQDSDLDRVKVLVSIRADLLHELHELQKTLHYTLGPQDLIKLERFSPEEATKILEVIAETEHLDFDPRFVIELAEEELAHRESGTISPVDLQILAWMIERQKSDDLRAFNRTAFQKFGGVEGLLTRFLDRTLDVRILPDQRQAAVKVLLALTDLDRQVRVGMLTVPELQTKLQGTVKPDDIEEAVTWLSRGDVRLITPQDKEGARGYELAHERLIPALMRVAGKELTAANKANQLLERRVNEWLGNQRSSRFLLGWRELLLIQRQRPYLVWGTKRTQKARLIRLSQRRTYSLLGIVGGVILAIGTFYGWLNFTPPGQIQQLRWGLSGRVGRISLTAETTAAVANALIKDTQCQKGLDLIRDYIESRRAKADALQDVAQTAVRLDSPDLLHMTLDVARGIDSYPVYKSGALSGIASAYSKLAEGDRAQAVLLQALTTAEAIDDLESKSDALSAIASVAGQLAESDRAQVVLLQALTTAEAIDDLESKSRVLRAIASAYSQLAESDRAQAVLLQALTIAEAIEAPRSKSDALSAIASAYSQLAESDRAQAVLLQALTIAEAIEAPRSKSDALSAIASAAGQLAESDRAQAVLLQALTIAEAIEAPRSKSDALSAIASAYSQLAESDRAQAVLLQALTTAEAIDDFGSKSGALRAIASAAGQLAESDRAQAVLLQALITVDPTSSSWSSPSVLSAIASAAGQLAEGDRAQVVLLQALATAEAIDDPFPKSEAFACHCQRGGATSGG